jgi:predicted TIM-barrel fold metal-dependent hydrolase
MPEIKALKAANRDVIEDAINQALENGYRLRGNVQYQLHTPYERMETDLERYVATVIKNEQGR